MDTTMKNIDKVIVTKKIKDANNIDTTKENVALVNAFWNAKDFEATNFFDEQITTHPLVKCREFYPEYLNAYNNLVSAIKSEIDIVELSNLIYALDDIQIDFAAALIDFGSFEPAYKFKDLPEKFVMSHDEFEKQTLISCVGKSLDILSMVNVYLSEALEKANKSKCMTLSPYITGCCYNMTHSLEIKKTRLQ